MASVLIVVFFAAGEVLARRNIGTAPRPDVIWFRRKHIPSEGACFISLYKKGFHGFDSKNCPCLRLPLSFPIPGLFVAEILPLFA